MNRELQILIGQGEHQEQDFKYCINDSRKIAKSLVAFANTDGGRLLIGVRDNGSIAGVKSDEEYYMVEAAAKIYSKPQIDFEVRQWNVDGKIVLEVTVEPSEERPHYARDDEGRWWAYIRCDDENIQAKKLQLEVWEKQKKGYAVFFNYSKNEQILLDMLRKNESLTVSRFSRKAKIHFKRAEKLIVDFILMGVIDMNYQREQLILTLNEDVDCDNFEDQIKNTVRT
ncbi:ATP-binding protein [Puteibacter caeruleilacunae]|nr:ATP-binding protein [Puteibacter caeruleilacunae]